MESIERWYKAKFQQNLRKVELAYEVLEIKSHDPTINVIDSKRRTAFKSVCSSIISRFEEIKSSQDMA